MTDNVSPADQAKALEHQAAELLVQRRQLLTEHGLPIGFGLDLFTEVRALGIKWNIELPVFRRTKRGTIETLLYFGAGRGDAYRDTYFVPGVQQPAGQGPSELLAGLGKKLGVELASGTGGNSWLVKPMWAGDCPVAPLLSLVYATSAPIPDVVPGAAWCPMGALPSPIAPNHLRLLEIGLHDFKRDDTVEP